MAIAGVIGHDVEHDLDAALGGLRDQFIRGPQVAELRLDIAVVRDVVTHVRIRRYRDRGQPDGVDPQPLQVIEPADDPAQVTDAVAIRVLERARVDLVDERVSPAFAASLWVACLLAAFRTPVLPGYIIVL